MRLVLMMFILVKISWEKTPTYIAGQEVFQISCMRIPRAPSVIENDADVISSMIISAELVRLSSQVLLTLGTYQDTVTVSSLPQVVWLPSIWSNGISGTY